MSEDLRDQITRMWGGFRKKAAETIASQEAAFARGKVAAAPVLDDLGNVIVDAGRRIDDSVIERAVAAGKLHSLALAAGKAQAQDLTERAREAYDRTADGQEARSLDSVDDYAEARAYIGRTAGIDVTDTRGNIIIPAGREIEESDVRAARQAGLLQALIYSAQQPAPHVCRADVDEPTVGETAVEKPVLPMQTEAPQRPHAPLPVLTPPEKEP